MTDYYDRYDDGDHLECETRENEINFDLLLESMSEFVDSCYTFSRSIERIAESLDELCTTCQGIREELQGLRAENHRTHDRPGGIK
jgi:hypothetical protein